MKRIIGFSIAMFVLLFLVIFAAPVFADGGLVPVSEVSVYEPGQKAIIAWNGEEEILILSVDAYASDQSLVLRILPLPSEPEAIHEGDFSSFLRIEELMEEHVRIPLDEGIAPGGPGIEIVFHEKIGAHDITVVRARDAAEFIDWAQGFLQDVGVEADISSPDLENVVGGYIEQEMEFFVFDLLEVTSAQKSIEPIVYRFRTPFLYYPLVISSVALGGTDITLFLLTQDSLSLRGVPGGMNIGYFYGMPVEFQLDGEELRSIDPEIAQLLGDSAWLTALTYEGRLKDLQSDLKLQESSAPPEVLGPEPGETDVSLRPCFFWAVVTGATNYEFQLSDEEGTLIVDLTGANALGDLQTFCYNLEDELEDDAQYLWRVRGINPVLGMASIWASASFTTGTSSFPWPLVHGVGGVLGVAAVALIVYFVVSRRRRAAA